MKINELPRGRAVEVSLPHSSALEMFSDAEHRSILKNKVTNYLKELKHYQPYYRKQRPDKVFFANIMAYSCNS